MTAAKPTKPAASETQASVAAKPAKSVIAANPAISTAKPKAAPVTVSKSKPKAISEDKKDAVKTVEPVEKKKTVKAAATAAPAKAAAKRAPKAKAVKAGKKGEDNDVDMSDIEDDLVGEPEVVEVTAEKVKPLRMKISKAKERALMKEFGLDETVLSEDDLNKRRLSLKALIKLGKTRGYLTHGEISDHLPDKLVDAETMEVVVSMLNDMGVAVYEHTPDAETLLLNQNGPTAATEEEAEEEAEAALSTVDSEFGRTTDPVRMYMREMGTVELLTREGEIEIAKRIEGGLMAMMEAISASPASVVEILQLGEDIRSDKVVITTIVDGFTNPNEADDYVAEEDFDEFDADDDDDGNGGSKALTRKLEELKKEAMSRFDRLREYHEKILKTYEKEGYGTPVYLKTQKLLSDELMSIRFTAKTIEKLCDMVRGQVDEVRKKERELRRIIVDKCGYPHEQFIAEFSGRDKHHHKVPSHLLDLKWIEKHAAAGKSWSAVMGRNIPPVQELQQGLMNLQTKVVVPLDQLKDINKRMNEANTLHAQLKRK